jgi:hypothetical protein
MKVLQMPIPSAFVLNASVEAPRPRNEEHSPWAVYRNHTIVLLRKYFRMSLELGRMPSLLGGELFRAKVTAYQVHTFEDAVIFVHDMDQCLAKLDPLSRLLIGRIVLQEFTREETARELRVHERHVRRRLLEGIDRLTKVLLRAKLLDAFGDDVGKRPPTPAGVATVLEFRGEEL